MMVRHSYRNHRSAYHALLSILLSGGVVLALCGLTLSQVKRVPRPAVERLPIKVAPILDNEVAVPDLTRQNLADADALLMANNLKLGVVDDVLENETMVDHVLRQSPSPRAKVLPGSSVNVQVGVANTVVPPLKGRPLQDVQKALRESHLDVGHITSVNLPGVQSPGRVINSDPVEGTIVRSHRIVTLLVQAGRVKVPDLTGQTLLGAQSLLAKNELALGAVTGRPFRVESKGPAMPNAVSDWSPKGQVVLVGTAIDLLFPVDYELVNARAISALGTSEMVKTIGNGRSINGKQYPKIDRLTSLELLANLEPPKPGSTIMTVMARLYLPPIYPAGIKATEKFEGWVDHLYNDAADYCTIGFGHLIKRVPCNGSEPYQDGISFAQGVNLLQDDLYTAHATVFRTVTVKLTDGQVAALTDFVFNVGSANFRSSTLLKVVNASQMDGVPTQFRRWVMAGGKQLPGLVQRREGEINLFFDGMRTVMIKKLPSGAAPPPPEPPIDIMAGEGR